jgi:hypothetical protein
MNDTYRTKPQEKNSNKNKVPIWESIKTWQSGETKQTSEK